MIEVKSMTNEGGVPVSMQEPQYILIPSKKIEGCPLKTNEDGTVTTDDKLMMALDTITARIMPYFVKETGTLPDGKEIDGYFYTSVPWASNSAGDITVTQKHNTDWKRQVRCIKEWVEIWDKAIKHLEKYGENLAWEPPVAPSSTLPDDGDSEDVVDFDVRY